MKPRATPPSTVQPSQRPSEVIAELLMAMPIVLLVGALYEAFVEPSGGTPSLVPVQA